MFKCTCRNVSVQVQVWKCQCVSVSVEVSVFKRFSGRTLRNAFGKNVFSQKGEQQANLRVPKAKTLQVTHFDVFLSHTWQTPGHWKVLSLLLQAGWKYMLLMWAASAFLIRILDLVSVLPMPSDCRFRAAKFEHVCSYFPWCLAASLPVQLLALLMTPYLPYLPNITYSSCFKRWTLQKEEDKGAHKNGTGDVHEGDGQNDSRRAEKQSEEIEMSLDRKPFASDAHDIVNGSSKKEKQMQQICSSALFDESDSLGLQPARV